ncbi:MAG: Fe(2+)-trafficking protein [Phycisphaerae bacterium]|nr:Fe(2+)-trafficking protein [Phycisphaerae bacterium]
MTPDERIAQFKTLVDQNPNDEMAQFSLGSAYFEARRYSDAGPCFQRVLALNPNHSMAILMLGRTQIETGHPDLAKETLTNGYRVAHRRGELKPRNEMGELLQSLGAALPSVDEPRAAAGAIAGKGGEGGFTCSRCGGSGPRLAERPFKGPLGEKVLANVCTACWQEWIRMGTKVINELRLPMYDPAAQEQFDHYMKDFLSLPD